MEFMETDWLKKPSNLVLIGPSGVGKTHVVSAICYDAVTKGKQTVFLTLFDPRAKLTKARSAYNLIDYYAKAPVLCVDEVGYVVATKEQADILFQIISKRVEIGTTIVTTNLLCPEIHKRFNAVSIVMRSPLLASPAPRYFVVFLPRTKEPACREAISSSVALKRPDRSFGATMASKASSLTDGSARVYISVVCIFTCPSQRDTLRMSPVAWRTVSAQVCHSTCGEMHFDEREEQRFEAVLACLRRMYSKPERVMGWPRALRNSSGASAGPLSANLALKAAAVSLHKGRQRSFRPLPWMRMLGCG
jgi:hypothetical protein